MQSKRLFLASFAVIGFMMKIAAELVHEVLGHSLLVLLFGGEIAGLYISVLWPYDFSYVWWSLPDATPLQLAWIYASGILACLMLSFLIQVFLFWKCKVCLHFKVALFWLAFWTFVSSAGYLLIGGLTPFGDLKELIRLGVLTKFLSLFIGIAVFVIGFVFLSILLKGIILKIFPAGKAVLSVAVFWLIIPLLVAVMAANPERSVHVGYFLLAFVPALTSFLSGQFISSPKHDVNAYPDNVAEE